MFAEATQLETHRVALNGHCYRMLGSLADADDAVQETMVRAFRKFEQFDGRASLRTWLYRIATNVCLDQLSSRSRRARPMEEGPCNGADDALVQRARTHWLEPVPDAQVLPADSDPAELATLRQSIRLAFVAALQHLPPKQRAVLLLTDVLGWSAAEAAESLELSVASVNSALQRARATLSTRDLSEPRALSSSQTQILERYVSAFERYDVDELVALVRDDATFSMPPYALWLRGPKSIREWLQGRGVHCRGSKLIATNASGAPAFAQYVPRPGGGYSPWALIVLELADDGIVGWNSFLDTETLFPRFGFASELPG
jgi:RNA polymerase sigma-70 factor (ECF subfamily)